MSNPDSVNKLKVVEDTQCQLTIHMYLNTQCPYLREYTCAHRCTPCACTCECVLIKTVYMLKTSRIPYIKCSLLASLLPWGENDATMIWTWKYPLKAQTLTSRYPVQCSEMGLWANKWIMRALVQSAELFIDGLLDQMDCCTVVDTGQLKGAGHSWERYAACHPECSLAAMRWTALSTTSDP